MPERPDEFGLIARFFAPLAAAEPGAFGLTDDAAVISGAPGRKMVVTTDCMIAGVHFLDDDPPDGVAAKLLAVNLSDLAAMGATPRVYTLSAAWPKKLDVDWIERFARGLGAAQKRAGVALVGGDTVAGPGPLTLTVTAIGALAGDRALLRSGVRPGDRIYVSGTIGDATLGLRVLTGELELKLPRRDLEFLISRYRRPEARIGLGRDLASVATGAADVSDGLVADVDKLAVASTVSITIRAESVPLSEATRSILDKRPDLFPAVLTGGDDYELVFSAPSDVANRLFDLGRSLNVPITEIGSAEEGAGGTAVVDGDGQSLGLSTRGYRHF